MEIIQLRLLGLQISSHNEILIRKAKIIMDPIRFLAENCLKVLYANGVFFSLLVKSLFQQLRSRPLGCRHNKDEIR